MYDYNPKHHQVHLVATLVVSRHGFGCEELALTKRDAQWDRCLSNLVIKSTLGLGFGVVFSVLLFKRRSWPAIVGLGFGAGRAYEECNSSLKLAAIQMRRQAWQA